MSRLEVNQSDDVRRHFEEGLADFAMGESKGRVRIETLKWMFSYDCASVFQIRTYRTCEYLYAS